MFKAEDIIYEDNHLMVVNKCCGDLVQPDPNGESALEDQIKAFIKRRDSKPGDVFLGVVHRIDRPVSGAVLFTKTTKSLVRMNEMIKNREVDKRYWAVVESAPKDSSAELIHHIVRNSKTNQSKALDHPSEGSKEARLRYNLIAASDRYFLLEIELLTGRHHQIRAQLARIGMHIKGDLKYGSARSNRDGGICLHSRSLEFIHPVTKAVVKVVATPPLGDPLWVYFNDATGSVPKK